MGEKMPFVNCCKYSNYMIDKGLRFRGGWTALSQSGNITKVLACPGHDQAKKGFAEQAFNICELNSGKRLTCRRTAIFALFEGNNLGVI